MSTNAVDRAMLSHIFALPGNGKKKRKPSAGKTITLWGRKFHYQPRVSRRSWEGWFQDQQGTVYEAATVAELKEDAEADAIGRDLNRCVAGRLFPCFLVSWTREDGTGGESKRERFASARQLWFQLLAEKPTESAPIVEVRLWGSIPEDGVLEAIDGWWKEGRLHAQASGDGEAERRGTLNA